MHAAEARPAGTASRGRRAPTGVWVLRHGESTANVEGLIVSAAGPRALTEVGLTPHGRAQARGAADAARDLGFGPGTVVVSSDFARALQTAEEFAVQLGAAAPRIDERLRERCFGTHDEGPTSAYETVWAADRQRRGSADGVEAVGAVATRVGAALRTADETVRGAAAETVRGAAGETVLGAAAAHAGPAPVVLVAHGDVLQIALAVGAGMDPHDHRDVPHLGNAELRRLGPARGGAR